MFKKLISIGLILQGLVSFAGCAETNTLPEETATESAETTASVEPETDTYIYNVPAENKTEKILYAGTDAMPYCAFPTIAETDEGILCVWKQGSSHMEDYGITSFMWMDKAGNTQPVELLAQIEGFNTQNAEVLTMPDGTIRCYLDIQDPTKGKERTGTIVYEYHDGVFELLPGILTDTAGKQYGYVFDGVEWQGRYWMLAMTFPELDYPNAQKSVELLVSDDNGETWEDVLCLDTFFDAPLNESSLAVIGDRLYIMSRCYDKDAHIAVFDKDLNPIHSEPYNLMEKVVNTGRPKLFVKDGQLYAILRNHHKSRAAMDLSMLKIHTDTLAIERIVILDADKPEDGYYAEPYFDGDKMCVITYKPTSTSNPDIVLLTYNWNEIK